MGTATLDRKATDSMIQQAKDAVVATINNTTVMNWVIASLSTATLTLAGFCTYYVMEIRAAANANAAAIAEAKHDIAETDTKLAVLTERQLWWSTSVAQLREEMKELKSAIGKLDDRLGRSGMN